MRSPSVRASTDSSSPSRNASTTISLPASPRDPASIARTTAAASARVSHTTAPLPAASPEAFTTSGSAWLAMWSSATFVELAPALDHIASHAEPLDERGARGGWYSRAAHDFFGICLRRLEPGRRGRRSEHRAPFVAQAIGQPRGERCFGTDDGEIDIVASDRRNDIVDGGRGDREVGAETGGPGVPGSGKNNGVGGVALQSPTQGVLAAAASDDQYSHLFLNASVNAWAARLAESTTSFTTAFASFI